MQFVWKYIDDLVGKGLEWHVIARLLFYTASTLVPMALPLALLLASIMTLGNLGEQYELVALKSSGISLWRILRSSIITAVLLSGLAFMFSNYILPVANLKAMSLLYDVREKRPAVNIKEGIFYKGIDDFVIKVAKKDKDGKTIHNVMIYDHRQRMGNTTVTTAKHGYIETTENKQYMYFRLYDGCNYDETINRSYSENQSNANRPLTRLKFKEQYKRFDLSAFSLSRTNEELFKKNHQMMNLKQLEYYEDSLKKKLDSVYKLFFVKQWANFQNVVKLDSTFISKKDSSQTDYLSNFDLFKQKAIIERALVATRSERENINFSKEELVANKRTISKFQLQWHHKFSLSFACFVLFFIGAPLGAIIRKGGFGLPVVVSILFFVFFHIVSIIGDKLVKEDVVEAWQGTWMSALIFLPIGLFLTLKATSDSPLLDATTYIKFYNKVFKRNKNKVSKQV